MDMISDKDYPRDFILCNNRFPRLVVACMHHCPFNEFCELFYTFFRDREISPIDYYNKDGLGEKVMRRIVFDCDRCKKKDVTPVFSLYSREGVGEEFLLSQEELEENFKETGYPYAPIGEAVHHIMELMGTNQSWAHLCDKCYRRLVDDMGKHFKIGSVLTEKKIKKLETSSAKKAKKKDPIGKKGTG